MICLRLIACDSPMRKFLFWKICRMTGSLCVRFKAMTIVFMDDGTVSNMWNLALSMLSVNTALFWSVLKWRLIMSISPLSALSVSTSLSCMTS